VISSQSAGDPGPLAYTRAAQAIYPAGGGLVCRHGMTTYRFAQALANGGESIRGQAHYLRKTLDSCG